ncbi:hypothetical protein D9M72_292290 [compost metagenome]
MRSMPAISVHRVFADRDVNVGVRFRAGGVANADFLAVVIALVAGICRSRDAD